MVSVDDLSSVDIRELRRRRLELLRETCLSCDLELFSEECVCDQVEAEVQAIDQELRQREEG